MEMGEIGDIKGKKKPTEARGYKKIVFCIVLVTLLLCINLVSASQDWDNVKIYDKETKTITIKNSVLGIDFLTLGDVASIKLETPIDNHIEILFESAKDVKVWEMTINNKDDSYSWERALKRTELFNRKNDEMSEVNRNIIYKYKEIYYKDWDVKEDINTPIEYVNGSVGIIHERIIIKTIKKKEERWIEIDLEDPVPIGKDIIIGAFTDVRAGESIEWIPTYFGDNTRIEEWASWTIDLNTNLEYYIKLNATDTFKDSTGKYNLTNSNSFIIVNGKIGGGIDTSTGSIIFSEPLGHTILEGDFTICMWINATGYDGDDNVWSGRGSDNVGIIIEGNEVRLQQYDGVELSTVGADWSTVNSGEWYFICGMQNGTGMYFYMNGTQTDNNAETDAKQDKADDDRIGALGGGASQYHGGIDEVSFWSDDLTPEQIIQLYNGGAGMTYEIEFDSTPPNVTINLPANTSYGNTVIFNITSEDDESVIDSCLYSLDNGASNFSMTNSGSTFQDINTSMQNGDLEVYYYCNDSLDNWNITESISFSVDAQAPDINLIEPQNITYTSQRANVNYTFAETGTCDSVWFSDDSGVTNSSPVNCGINFSSPSTEGANIWTVYINDSWDNQNSSSVSFFVDTIIPIVNITTGMPFDYGLDGLNQTLNWSINDSNLEACWYEYNGENVTQTCGNNGTSFASTTNTTFTLWANDSVGNLNYETITISFKLYKQVEAWSNITNEGSYENFKINVTLRTGLTISIPTLIYNNTPYITGFTDLGSNLFEIERNLVIPDIIASVNQSFYWSFLFTNGETANTTSNNQSVVTLNIDDCSVYTNQLFNVTMYDEDDQTLLVGGTENTTLKVFFTLKSTNNQSELLNFSYQFNYTNSARLCLENPLNDSEFRLDGVMEYSARFRFVEFYHFQNYTLNSVTSDINISLYNLNSSNGQEFKILYKDSNFVPVPNAIIEIQRKYVGEGVFKTVERIKTGTDGTTIAHLVINDVIYNLLIFQENTLIATFLEQIADCQNPTLTSCTITLNSYGSSVLPDSFAEVDDLIFTITFNASTRIVSSIYTIPSGAVSTVDLNVTLFDNLGNSTVCSQSLTSSGGTLTCTVPASFGNSTIIAKISKDGIPIGQSFIKIKQKPKDIYGASIIFIALFGIVLMMGIGITDNPMILGIMMVFGMIVLISLNIIYSPSFIGVGATILWFIVAIILILIKGSNRQ